VTVQRRYMKKKVEGRTVLLHPEAKAALAVWLEELQVGGAWSPSAYVFQSRKGTNRPIDRRHAWRILGEAYAANGLTG
jgi:integrase